MSPNKFTYMEGMSLLCAAFIFQAFNEIIAVTVREVGTAAWLSQILSGVLTFGILYLYLILFRRFEGKSLMEIVEEIFGKPVGKVILTMLMLFFLFLVAVTLHETVMLLRSFAYAETEPLFLCMALMGVACIVCRHPAKGLAMTASLFLPFFLLLIFAVIALIAPQFNLHFLTPVLGFGPDKIARQSFFLVSNYENFLMAAVFLPMFGSTKQFGKSIFTALIVCGVCFFGVTLAYNLVFPYTAIFQNSSAMLNMTQSVYINRFLQRFESAFVAGVSSSAILVLCVGLLAVKTLFCHLFQVRSENTNAALYPLTVLIILTTESLAALNKHENSYRSFAHRYSAFVMVGFILLMWGITLLRKKGTPRRLRVFAVLLVPCLLAAMFSGCGGYHEPDEEIYPLIMGYDKGETEKYRITFRFMLGKEAEGTPDVNNTISIDENGDPPPEIFIVEAPSALVALDSISSLVPKRYSLMHINMMVVSEELAREGLMELVSPIVRHKETKNTMAFLVTRGTAQETIMAPTGKLDSSLPMFIESILEGRNGISNYDTVTIKDVYSYFEDGYGDGVAMYAGYEGLVVNETYTLDPEGYLLDNQDTPDPQTSFDYADSSQESSEADSDASQKEELRQGQMPENEASTTGITPESLDKELGNDEDEDEGGEGEEPAESPASEGAQAEQFVGPGDEDALEPLENRPAAERVEAELSKSINQGYIPGELPVKSSAKLEIAGMAVLRNQNMVGFINNRENAIHMMLKGNFYNGYYDLPDPNHEDAIVVYRVHSRQATKVDVEIDDDGKAHLQLEVFLKGRITVAQNTSVRYTDADPRNDLEEYTSRMIEEEANRLVHKLQKEFEADTLHMGKYISGKFLTIEEWEEYDWPSHYPDADIQVKVHFKL